MRIDQVSVELRPRSSWEAVELGTALVRTHARAIWLPYVLLTLPVFLAICIGFAFAGWLSYAALAYWWLKPVFDRVPLFVVSRAVFGTVPGTRETLAAQRTWGWRWMLHYLTWRRFGPYRSLYLPVDLLEGGTHKHERRNVIGGSARGVAAWVTVVFANFEMAFVLGLLAVVPLFLPVESWPEFADTVGKAALADTGWVNVVSAVSYYLASTLLEPFYVGAGFGIYLNRRTQLEAWDVEIAFRRLRERLGGALAVACVAIGLLTAPQHDAFAAPAQTQAPPLREALGDRYVDPASFEKAVEATQQDPLLHPVDHRKTWVPRAKPRKVDAAEAGPIVRFIIDVVGGIVKYGLWIVAGLLIGVLAWTFRSWWPWVRSFAPERPPAPSAIETAPIETQALPPDVAAAARALWARGLARRALALLYRASVESMLARTGATLVPGATEADCLRASRALGAAEDREAFARVVRTWQYAAYADRLPAPDEFESVLSLASARFGWAA